MFSKKARKFVAEPPLSGPDNTAARVRAVAGLPPEHLEAQT